MGNTSLSLSSPSGSGFSLPGQNTFKDILTNNGIVQPNGTFQIVLHCVDAPGVTNFGDFVGTVTFTHTTQPVFEASYTSSVPAKQSTTTVSVPAANTAFGTQATFGATVSPTNAAGTIVFKDNGVALGSGQAIDGSGHASFSTSTLSAGTHQISASFVPTDSNAWATSSSSGTPFTVDKAATSVSITGNGTSQYTDNVTFVAHTPAGVAGSVVFKIDGTATAGGAVTVSSGTASYSTTTLPVGNGHTIDATFTPTSSNYSPSAAPQVTHDVTAFAGKIATETINATVDAGALTISIEGSPIVNLHALGDPANPNAVINASGDLLQAEGDLANVVITDTRAGDPGWNATGSVGNFSNASTGDTVSGYNLGWVPALVSHAANQDGNGTTTAIFAGAAVAAGSQQSVAAGAPSDPAVGLGIARQFAHTFDNAGNGTAKIGAHVTLNIPTDVGAGTYTATLTFTVI
ncbi:MAG: Ig-like domain repeat protein [Marmoricola sp.]